MKTVSVKLTFTDDDWYDWFIEPKKINNELPNLVLRLLRAYSDNEELALEIDQFLDRETEPEVYETRAAIAEALNRLNNLDNTISQDIAALDSEADDSSGVSFNEDDDDVVVTDSDGNFAYTPESVIADLGAAVGYDPSKISDDPVDLFGDSDTTAQTEPSTSVQQTSAPQAASQGTSEIDKILTALGMMTGQVAQLTETVSNLVTLNANMTAQQSQMVQPQQAQVETPAPEPTPAEPDSSDDDEIPDFMMDVLNSLDQ